MKIYADWYYDSFLKNIKYERIYQDHNTIPNDTDIIAVTKNHCRLEELQLVIDELLPKTKKLFFTLLEATHPNLVDLLLKNNNPKIEFFVDAVINLPASNVKSINSWFMCPHNLYNTIPTLQTQLLKISPQTPKNYFFDCLLGRPRDIRDQITRFYKNSKYKDKIIYSYLKKIYKPVFGTRPFQKI